MELTSYCDLTCSYCPNKDMERERAHMSDEVWQTILYRYIVPFKNYNSFSPPTFIGHKDGEPLLNKKFPDRLRDLGLAAPDMKIDIYSHGLMLPKLAMHGKDFIYFLGNLPNQVRYMMSYHPFNHDGSANDYSEVVDYLRPLLILKANAGEFQNIEFITVSHRSKWVPAEIQTAWRLFWQGLPMTVHENCSINPWTGRIEEATCKYNGCPYADFGHWFFGATGNIIACCLDLEEEIVLGNVMTDDPDAMFAKTEAFYAEQRRILEQQRRVAHPVCANCFGQERQEQVELVQLGVM